MKTPTELIDSLVNVGLYTCGGNETPEQQELGADLLEAAVYLMKTFKYEGKMILTTYQLQMNANGMRDYAEKLRRWGEMLREATSLRSGERK